MYEKQREVKSIEFLIKKVEINPSFYIFLSKIEAVFLVRLVRSLFKKQKPK